MVSASHRRGGDGDLPHQGSSPGFAVVALIVTLIVLLMGFSVGAVLLGQAALAAMAGTAAVGLAGETIRRALHSPESEPSDVTEAPTGPTPSR